MTNVVGSVVQVVLAVLASGLAVKLLTIRQDRRKIAGDASSSEANAASVLTGSAMQLVEQAQKSAREAEARQTVTQRVLDLARSDNDRLWRELATERWKVQQLEKLITDHRCPDGTRIPLPALAQELFPPESQILPPPHAEATTP